MSPQLYEYAWTQQLIQRQRTTSTTLTTPTTMTTTTTPHHNSITHRLWATSCNIILINICIHIVIHQSKLFMTNKTIWKLTILPKTFMSTPKENSKQKCVKTTQEHEKVHCYYVSRLAGWLTRRGELAHSPWQTDGEQPLLFVTIQLASRAHYSPWRVVTDFCQEERFFTPKTQFSSTPIQNLIGNSTYDDSTTWISIIHGFNGFLHYQQPISTPKPNSQIHKTTTTTTC